MTFHTEENELVYSFYQFPLLCTECGKGLLASGGRAVLWRSCRLVGLREPLPSPSCFLGRHRGPGTKLIRSR